MAKTAVAVATTGGLIPDCGIRISDESKLENVKAMFAAARRYHP